MTADRRRRDDYVDRLQRATDAIDRVWERAPWSAPIKHIAAAVLAAFADDFNELDRLREMALGEGVTVIDTKRDDELDRLRAENIALRLAGDGFRKAFTQGTAVAWARAVEAWRKVTG